MFPSKPTDSYRNTLKAVFKSFPEQKSWENQTNPQIKTRKIPIWELEDKLKINIEKILDLNTFIYFLKGTDWEEVLVSEYLVFQKGNAEIKLFIADNDSFKNEFLRSTQIAFQILSYLEEKPIKEIEKEIRASQLLFPKKRYQKLLTHESEIIRDLAKIAKDLDKRL